MPPSIESQDAVESQRTSRASSQRLLTTSRLAVTLLAAAIVTSSSASSSLQRSPGRSRFVDRPPSSATRSVHKAGGGEAVDRQIDGGGDAAAILQGGDPAVDGADLELQGAHAAVR